MTVPKPSPEERLRKGVQDLWERDALLAALSELVAARDAAAARADRAEAALKAIEWVATKSTDKMASARCPCCGGSKERGHFPSCDLARALAAPPAPRPMTPPDKNCITLPDGDCVGGPCMHNPSGPPQREPTEGGTK